VAFQSFALVVGAALGGKESAESCEEFEATLRRLAGFKPLRRKSNLTKLAGRINKGGARKKKKDH
jgi:hypothetical protein